jgi:septal ring factor EnvC (AmiA/AmiB activator)
MNDDQQNRVFTISTKVSSTQKANFMKQAEKHNLSLSEWICGTLDMSINAYSEISLIEKLKQIQEENHKLEQIIAHYKFRLLKAQDQLNQKTEMIEQLEKANLENSTEVEVMYFFNKKQHIRK